jgi:hypothetical protein
MTQSGTLLTVIVVAALALPPSASLAQQRQQIPPGGPIFPSGRVLRGPGGLPDLKVIDAFSSVKCIRPLVAEAFVTVGIKNDGKGPAVMPPTMPTLGQYWVGVWDPFTVPGVMAIAAAPPSQLLPGKGKSFVVSVAVSLRVGPAGGPGYAVFVQVDPANLIFESDENNNIQGFNFISKSFCQ